MINPNGIDLDKMKTEDFDELISNLTEIMEDMVNIIDAETMVGAEEYRERANKVFKEYE